MHCYARRFFLPTSHIFRTPLLSMGKEGYSVPVCSPHSQLSNCNLFSTPTCTAHHYHSAGMAIVLLPNRSRPSSPCIKGYFSLESSNPAIEELPLSNRVLLRHKLTDIRSIRQTLEFVGPQSRWSCALPFDAHQVFEESQRRENHFQQVLVQGRYSKVCQQKMT